MVIEENAILRQQNFAHKSFCPGEEGNIVVFPMHMLPGYKSARYHASGGKTGIGLFIFPLSDPILMKKWETVFMNLRRKEGADNFESLRVSFRNNRYQSVPIFK